MPDTDKLNRFIDLYNEYKNFNTGKLLVKDGGKLSLVTELGPLLSQLEDKITKTSEIADVLSNEVLDNMSNALHFHNTTTRNHLQLNSNEIVANREKIIKDYKEALELFLLHFPTVAALYADKSLNKISNITAESSENAKEIEAIKNKFEADLINFEDRYKLTFSKSEILKQRDIFVESSQLSAQASKWWLLMICILVTGVLFIAFLFLTTPFDTNVKNTSFPLNSLKSGVLIESAFYATLIKNIILRLFILTFIIYLIKFAVKNYNALQHNKTVNRHKADSLAAASVLVERLAKEESKDSILNLAAKEIFVQKTTGYVKNDKID